MEAHDRLFTEEGDFDRAITIDTPGVRTTEFDLSEVRALRLYEWGRTAAKKLLPGRALESRGALRTFRIAERPSRRQAVAALRQRVSSTDTRIEP